MARISDSYCLNHPDTPAAARCATCGKHVCEKCIVIRNGVQYCSEACADAAASTVGRVDAAVEAGRRNAARARTRGIITLIILIAIAAGAWYYYKTHSKEVNSFVQKSGEKVQQGLDASKKSIQKGVPGDSKYKRDREGAVK